MLESNFLSLLRLFLILDILLVEDDLQMVSNLLDLLGVTVLGKILAELTEEVLDAVRGFAFVEDVSSTLSKVFVVLFRVEFDCFLNKSVVVTVISKKLVGSTLFLGFLLSLTDLRFRLTLRVNFDVHLATKLLLSLLELLVIVHLVLGLDPPIFLLFYRLLPTLLLLFLFELLRVDFVLALELLLLLVLLSLVVSFVVAVQLIFPIVVAHLRICD